MLAKRAAEGRQRDAQAAEGGGGILDMLGGSVRHQRAQRKGSMTVTQRVTREVTRTVVNQTVGIARRRTRQVDRRTAGRLHRPGHRARDARAGCCGGSACTPPLAGGVEAGWIPLPASWY